jgi:small GTP-binding protein
MNTKPETIRLIEEELGYELETLTEAEIITIPKTWDQIKRGYLINKDNIIAGFRFDFCFITEKILHYICKENKTTYLHFFDVSVTDISVLKDLPKLYRFYFDKENITGIPKEILDQGLFQIKEYLKSLDKQEKIMLEEIKILLIGEGGSGKTSLFKRIEGKDFDKDESKTHGITIRDIPVTIKRDTKEIEIIAHFWDFGGQEIMHASHKFFLSARSVYILVLDSRKDERPEHWLKHIQTFGGDSPIFIVQNKIDQNPDFNIDSGILQKRYPNIKGYFQISCATGKGIDTLKKQ